MKKTILTLAIISFGWVASFAQQTLQASVSKLDQAETVKDFEVLANEFSQLANQQQKEWLPHYYAAFCNAKIGWLKFEDPDNIEPYADKADEEIQKARELLDSTTQKKEMSEVYCVLSMVNRARVYINPMTYGRQYGIPAGQYTQLARRSNPDNPRALYIEGWEKYATPKLYGGDKKKAKELLTTAKQKLESNVAQDASPHWGKKEVEELLEKL
jgi:hypothetical protein